MCTSNKGRVNVEKRQKLNKSVRMNPSCCDYCIDYTTLSSLKYKSTV